MFVNITGGKARIDPEDIDIVGKYKWHVSSEGYAVWRGRKNGSKKTIRMHRLIMDTPDGMVTDHINHDRLDNRKINLRNCTQQDNMRNLTNQGKGYWYHKANRNWVVEIWCKHVGCFDTEEEAASVAEYVRKGGVYVKPERTHCKHGHPLEEGKYYNQNGSKRCKLCQSKRSKEYYVRKTKHKMERNNGEEVR